MTARTTSAALRERRDGPYGAAVLRGALEHLARAAGRAPSPGNSQPWRFRVRHGGVELLLDRDRALSQDAVGIRQARIACGAALFNLRLAVAELGYAPVVRMLPGGEPDLLARVELGALRPQPAEDAQLLAAAVYRHTHRDPFEPTPLPEGLLPALTAAAQAEGALLQVVTGEVRHRLDAVVAAAEVDPAADPLSRDGLRASWIPAAAGGLEVTAVLTTVADDARSHLVAGQALERVLLAAAPHWVFARLATRPLERNQHRAAVRTLLPEPGAPMVLLQLGRSRITIATARRPAVEAVVT